MLDIFHTDDGSEPEIEAMPSVGQRWQNRQSALRVDVVRIVGEQVGYTVDGKGLILWLMRKDFTRLYQPEVKQ